MAAKRKSKGRSAVEKERVDSAAKTVASIGVAIRELRVAQRMTLQRLSHLTNLSTSMISLVERGRASPSIGSLILIASALRTTLSDLIPGVPAAEDQIVVRAKSQRPVKAAGQLYRRILRQDRDGDLIISVTEYRPNAGTSRVAQGHAGFEHGFIIKGTLTVEIEGESYVLAPGDLISYDSYRAHRIWNHSKRSAKALWFNIKKERFRKR
jgi:transcriptional regulator with XRE-family HTH domain